MTARKQVHELADLVDVVRHAVGREAHDLELVAVLHEPEVLRHRQVHNPQRVRKERAIDDLDLGAPADRPRRADEVAEAVDRADGRVLERRDEERAREMRRMVLDPVDFRSAARQVQIEASASVSGIAPTCR